MKSQAFWLPKPLVGITPIHRNQAISIKISDVLAGKDHRKDSVVKAGNEDSDLDTLDGISITSEELNSYENLAKYLEAHSYETYSIRAIHICQPDSWSNLRITSACLDQLIAHHRVMPEFCAIASMFCSRRSNVEEAFCGSILQRESEDTFELAYVLKYPAVKPSLSDGSESWVIRQIGVYQQYTKSTGKSVWMFLYCKSDSKAQQCVTELLNEIEGTVAAQQYPIVLHLLLLSCYLHNWRDYILCFETELLKKVFKHHFLSTWLEFFQSSFSLRPNDITKTNKALGARLEDLPRISHETIARLHFIETRFSALPSIFGSTKSLFKAIETQMLNKVPPECPYRTQLGSYSSLVDSYSSNVEVLLRRCASLSQFMVNSISIKNQVNAQTQNDLMLRINQVMVRDSTSIKVITIVTLVYLPASFVATFFGMQFFQLSPQSLWMFFGVATFLTVLTIMGWLWSLHLVKRRTAEAVTDPEKIGAL